MKYLVDSDVIIDFMKGRSPAHRLIESCYPHGLAISTVSIGEVVDGIERGHDPRNSYETFNSFLQEVTILPLTHDVGVRFGLIRAGLYRTGQPLADSDIMIGATAIHHQLIMITGNARHFERIPGISIFKYVGSRSR